VRALGIFVLCVVLFLVPDRAGAKPFDAEGADWEAISDFVQIARDDLGASRVVVAAGPARLDLRDLKREDAIVIVHPERALDTEQLSSFMRHGGRVVLLDDYGTGDALLRHFNIARVPMPARPAETLRGNPQLAIAEPASNHPVVQGVSKVVTNHATGVRHTELSPVLKVRALGEPDVLLAEAGAVGQGRFLAIGDASIVINAMLRYPGNRALARGLVRYATDDDTWGKRGGRVFIAIGDFEQTGAFGSSGSAFWDRVSELTRAIEDVLTSVRRDGMPPMAAYVLAVVVGLAIVLWIGSRAGKTHRATPPRFVRGIPLVVQGGVAGHAAVVGAPSTSRVLAMLELKSAIEEDLCGLLGLEGSPGIEALVAKLEVAKLLEAAEMQKLRRILSRLSQIEMGVLARRSPATERIRDREVLEMAGMMRGLLLSAHGRSHGGVVPGTLPLDSPRSPPT
jgi:hypothetical protein